MGARIIGGKLPSVVYTGTFNSGGTGITDYPYTSKAMGTAALKRFIVVCVHCSGNTQTGVDVGGITCSMLGTNFNPTFWITPTPLTTGTTADVTVYVTTTGPTQMTVATWSVYDLISVAAYDTATSTASPASLNIDVRSRGIVIAQASGNAGATYTWTGATSDYTQTLGLPNNIPRNGAHYVAGAAESPRTVECAYSAASSPRGNAISLR